MKALRTERIVVLLCLFFLRMAGQATTGSIVGTITDPSGRVIAGAAVTVTNMDTAIATKTTTDGSGNYVATPLAIGRYSVAIEAPGFKRSISSGITINVQDRI